MCFDLALYSPYLLKMCIKIFADEMINNIISGISFKIIETEDTGNKSRWWGLNEIRFAMY